MTVNERLRHLRKVELGMTLKTFGEKLGVGQTTISSIETGVNRLSDQLIISICNMNWDGRHVSEKWLRTGEGSPFVSEPKDLLDILSDEYNLIPMMRVLMRKLAELGEEEQNKVLEFIEEVVDDAREGKADDDPSGKVDHEECRRRLHEELDRQLDLQEGTQKSQAS